MKHLSALFLFTLLFSTTARGDEYPRNNGIDILNYRFEIGLLDDRNTITGKADLTVRFVADQISTFSLDFIGKKPAGADRIKASKGMQVESVFESGRALSYFHKNNRLQIRMDPPPLNGEQRTISITYSGEPADGLIISNNKYNERVFFGDNWPNRARHWLPTVDHPYDKASFEFIVCAPCGALIEATDLDNSMRRTHFRESAPLPTKVMVIGVARFAVKLMDRRPDIPIQYWVFPQDKQSAFESFSVTPRIVDFYTNRIGPFSYAKLANVQSTTRYGGMENAGAIFYYQGSRPGISYSESLIAHEIAHQWFGDSISEADWNHIWLSEGFATYFTELYLEHIYGRERLKQDMEIALRKIIKYNKKHPTSPLVNNKITNLNALLNTNSYQKGAWILHMLRRRLGDEAWWRGIEIYFMAHKNGNAITADFKRAMEKGSGQDLSQFFKQWVFQPGHPQLKGSWSFDPELNSVNVTLNQVQTNNAVFKFKLDLGIYSNDGNMLKMETVDIFKKENSFCFDLDSQPGALLLDPDLWILKETDFRMVAR